MAAALTLKSINLRDPYKLISCLIIQARPTLPQFDIARLVANRRTEGNSDATIRYEISFIRQAFKHCHEMDYRTNRLIEFPKDLKSSKQRLRYLTTEEEKRLLKELNPMRKIETGVSLTDQNIRQQLQDNYDLVVLLLDTGFRLNEISHLEWKYADFNERKLHIWRRKNKVETVLDMTQWVFDILTRRDKSTKWFFANKKGDGPRNYCRTSFKKVCDRAGLIDV